MRSARDKPDEHDCRNILILFGYNPDDPMPKDEYGHYVLSDKLINSLARAPITKILMPSRVTHIPQKYKVKRQLSPTEICCLELAAEGWQNEEIAAIRCLAYETIKGHMKHILEALGATNRAHAVAIGFRLGILDAESGTSYLAREAV